MRFSTAFFATTTVSSLAVSAYSVTNRNNNAAGRVSELPFYHHDSLYKRADKPDMSSYSTFNQQAKELYTISSALKGLSKNGKMNMDMFETNKAIWGRKLFDIEKVAEVKLQGPFNLDDLIKYHGDHFGELEDASIIIAGLKHSKMDASVIGLVEEAMRLYTEVYKLYLFNGDVNTKVANIEIIVEGIEKDLAALEIRVREADVLTSAVRNFYSMVADKVKASLEEIKTEIS